MKLEMTPLRKSIVETLKNANAPMTLAEIAQTIGVDKIATGTTNAMVSAGVIAKGEQKVITCPCCGKSTKVLTYTIGSVVAE